MFIAIYFLRDSTSRGHLQGGVGRWAGLNVCLSLTCISQFPTVLGQQAFIKGFNFIRQPTKQSKGM